MMKASHWTTLAEEDLLNKKIDELGLTLRGTEAESWAREVCDELTNRGLIFCPPCFIADEWFVPEGIPAVGIPFYLTHDRLKKLEQKYVLEVEGGTKQEFLRLMRHETAHAYSYAYQLYRKKGWQKMFGLASKEESDTYRPKPYSRSFVIHLDNWYAQSHPDEDFAETFAVWMGPEHVWRERFKGWKAMRKLEYVDGLMKSIAGKPPLHLPRFRTREFSGLNIKLKTYFQRKKKLYEETYPEFYDNDLKKLFVVKHAEDSSEKASHFLKGLRRKIMKTVSLWTGERHYTVDHLLSRLIERCDELDLRIKKSDADVALNLAVFVTSLVTSYLFTGKFKRWPTGKTS